MKIRNWSSWANKNWTNVYRVTKYINC